MKLESTMSLLSEDHLEEGESFRGPSKGRTTSVDAFPELRHQQGMRDSVLDDQMLLKTSEKAKSHAAYAMLFAVFSDAVNLMCCAPNYPMMVTPGANDDSFPSIEPFGEATASYVLLGGVSFALVVSNILFGLLAGKIGSRTCTMILMAGSVIFTIARYFARGTFWSFTILSFVNALFGSTVAVGNGYISILFKEDRVKADSFIGYIMATSVAARSLGGLLSMMSPDSLFLPCIPAAALNAFALAMCTSLYCSLTREEMVTKMVGLDTLGLVNIIFGALCDNVGSLGIIPIAFNPILYQKFFADLKANGDPVIMSENEYRCIFSLIALTCVLPALMSSKIFAKVGVVTSCVIANLITALVIIALIFVSQMPSTKGSYIGMTSIIYFGFPLTVISNLSTGPMLDRVTPVDKKTLVQGINSSIYDGSYAVFPVVLALISDTCGYQAALWICFGVSILAALVNFPLVFNKLLQDQKENEAEEDDRMIDEDELQKLLDQGAYVSVQDQYRVNRDRADKGQPLLRTHYGKYSPEGDIGVFSQLYADDIKYVRDAVQERLGVLHNNPELKESYIQALNSTRLSGEELSSMRQEMGEWVSDYLYYNGYLSGMENAQIFKGLFINAFPTISIEKEANEDNIEDFLIKWTLLLNMSVEKLEGSEKAKAFKWLKIKQT
ncbi:hypothetical protein ACHAWF_004057 [Thalassiosira exigua]